MKFLSELSKETLICSELQVKDYKEILKSSYGEDVNMQLFIETLCEVFATISKKTPDYFKNLNLIDLFCFLLDVRVNSQGDECKVIITRDDTKMTLSLRLDYIKEELKALFGSITKRIDQGAISIVFECPSIQRILQPAKEEYLAFIRGCYIKREERTQFVEITTNEQAEQLIEKLSPKTLMHIIDQFEQFYRVFYNVNFLSRYSIPNQRLSFVPSLDSLLWYTKLTFSESLETFYSNLFYLSHLGNMGADYIENAVVGEYNYFVGQLRQTLASKNSSEDSNQNMQDNTGFPEDSF